LSLAGRAMLTTGSAWAGIVVSGTRVIYPGDSHELTVHLSNEGKTSVLVETWMDQGDPNIKPEDAQVPFTLSPPVFRLDPTKAPQQLHWKILAPVSGQDVTVQCNNPTPYAVSFNTVALQAGGKDLPTTAPSSGMAKPGETATFVMHGLKSTPAGTLAIDYQSIDDYGAMRAQVAPLNP